MFGSETITREILGNVPAWMSLGFYALAALACTLAAVGYFARASRRGRGRATREPAPGRFDLRAALRYLLFQEPIRRDPVAGVAHLLVVYGFIILFWGTTVVFLEHDTPLHFFYGWFYQAASLIVDLGGLAFVVGLGLFLWRRHVATDRPLLRGWWVASLTWLLFGIGVSGFLLEAARIAIDFPPHERWSVVGYPLACSLAVVGLDSDAARGVHRVLWLNHALLCVGFFGLLPWQFFSHMAHGLASWATRSTRPRSVLPLADETPGARVWTDFTHRDLLQADACTTCGRCVEVCPANAAGKPLRPREVVLGLRTAMTADPVQELTDIIRDETLWSCTTCQACNSVCPVGIDVYGKIVELRRGRVEAGVVPEVAERLFDAVADQSNPFGRPNSDRLLWADGLDVPVAAQSEPVELLYWVGCAGSFDPDGRDVSRAMVKLLKHLGVPFKTLGCRERCHGDPARRLGEEGLFREQATQVEALLTEHRVQKIITHCPHCLNSFRHETGPAAGIDTGRRIVQHHTEFLAEMRAAGRLQSVDGTAGDRPGEPTARPSSPRVTYHDPCYLARGNGIVDPPREVLAGAVALPLVEMPRNREQGFCCGAGGGAMWVDVPAPERVERIRAKEAAATGADVVATGCPFCKVMLRTGLEAVSQRQVAVKDIAELVASAEGL